MTQFTYFVFIRKITIAISCLLLAFTATAQTPVLTQALAEQLARLPLKCAEKEFPYKTGITFGDSSRVVNPREYHPIFYGCFDWHSSVHGHWMLIKLLKQFPGMQQKDSIRQLLNRHFTKENCEKELAIFQDGQNKSFERPYGWAWLFQLQQELLSWKDEDAARWAANLQPLIGQLSSLTISFLDKLVYPIRVGEHTNLAFGLRLSYDYAAVAGDSALLNRIKKAALHFYSADKNAPLSWEPGGYDFLSPTLEEAALLTRILPRTAYRKWLQQFLPGFFKPGFTLKIAEVKDRTDGKLVHLDGLNLSRVWCLKEIKTALADPKLEAVCNQLIKSHISAGLQSVASGDYAGEHWLASFAIYALTK